MVVVEKMVAFAIAYGGEFEWNNVIKFYILKACVCVSTSLKKKKIVENDPTHSWCLRWQMADAKEVCAVDFMLFYSWGYCLIGCLPKPEGQWW